MLKPVSGVLLFTDSSQRIRSYHCDLPVVNSAPRVSAMCTTQTNQGNPDLSHEAHDVLRITSRDEESQTLRWIDYEDIYSCTHTSSTLATKSLCVELARLPAILW